MGRRLAGIGDVSKATPAPGARRLARFGDRSKYGKRHVPGVMNVTESRYAEVLQLKKLSGEVLEWLFEAQTFKLADDCRFTPDFMVLYADGTIQFVDVKGGGPIDPKSVVKVKCAAEKFWCYRWSVAKARTKKDGGGFEITDY